MTASFRILPRCAVILALFGAGGLLNDALAVWGKAPAPPHAPTLWPSALGCWGLALVLAALAHRFASRA
jgi:hypothetical protein